MYNNIFAKIGKTYLIYNHRTETFHLDPVLKEESGFYCLIKRLVNERNNTQNKRCRSIRMCIIRLGSWCLTPLSTIFHIISWRSVLLMEETGVPGENHQPAASHRQSLSHNVVLRKPRLSGIKTHNVSGDRH